MRVLSGIQPSGTLHLGNYFGAMKQHIELQDGHDCSYFSANLHSLTTIQDTPRSRRTGRVQYAAWFRRGRRRGWLWRRTTRLH